MTTEELNKLYGEALELRAKLNAAMEATPHGDPLWNSLYAARGYANRMAAELYEVLPKLPRAGEDN